LDPDRPLEWEIFIMLNSPTHPRSTLLAVLAVVVVVTSVLVTGAVVTGAAQAGAPYVGQADIHDDLIVFTAENDLWTCNRQGENVRRLTTFVGAEYFPHFSPDGGLIAFTGEYDGNRDVYVIAANGGEPQRLTWHPARDEVVGWQPDGQAVILRSRRADPHRSLRLYTVAISGGDAVELPLGWATRLDSTLIPDAGPSTAPSANAPPGNAPAAALRRTSGSATRNRPISSRSPTSPARTPFPCGTAATSTS
jgi:hypothetical protein